MCTPARAPASGAPRAGRLRPPPRVSRGPGGRPGAILGVARSVQRMWMRITLPSGEDAACTRSQSWLTRYRPRPPRTSVGAGGSRPASGSAMWPSSATFDEQRAFRRPGAADALAAGVAQACWWPARRRRAPGRRPAPKLGPLAPRGGEDLAHHRQVARCRSAARRLGGRAAAAARGPGSRARRRCGAPCRARARAGVDRGRVEHLRRVVPRVVGAQQRPRRRVAEREVQQRLVAVALDQLGGSVPRARSARRCPAAPRRRRRACG